ncbi:dihydrofolate reductase family protein [Microbispora sp. H11081]|uniref:dihydrofolate reductase family protein n=1 Tax=Microbispora sp. H11081 TaxID=2729107 RepID=UPI00147636F1|nr:dihydrofolate reductase family protein [Microbispora sp. H11081]
MRKLIASVMTSLDGAIEHPELWSMDYWSDEAEAQACELLFASDALLLGRVTYEGFAEAWPEMTDESGYAERMNSVSKYVVSSTLEKADWNNSTVIGSDVAGEVAALKQQPGQNILTFGWGRLTESLLSHGLLDEVNVWLHPVLVGSEEGQLHRKGVASPLELVDSRTLASGIVILNYRPTAPKAPED